MTPRDQDEMGSLPSRFFAMGRSAQLAQYFLTATPQASPPFAWPILLYLPEQLPP